MRLINKASLVFSSSIIFFLISFLTSMVIAREMGALAIGTIGYAMGILNILTIFLYLGFDSAHSKRVTEGKNLADWIGVYLPIQILLTTIYGLFTYFLINFISNSVVSLIVGFLAIFLVLDALLNKLIKRPKIIIHPFLGAFLGGLGGFSSFIIHSGLPPIAMYLFPLSLNRQTFMGTVAVFFGITNIIKLLPYFMLGLFDKEILRLTICFVPITFFGIFIGKLINNKISDSIFFFVIYSTIFLLGLRLIWLSI